MTNQPIREALARAMYNIEREEYGADPWDEYEAPPAGGGFVNLHHEAYQRADAALSILSTALAERDERIAELEGLLLDLVRDEKPIDPLDMTNPFCGAPRTKDEILELARAKLKESERG